MLPRFVISFLSRKKRLLISKLQSLSTVILVPKKIKYVIASIVSLSICLEMIGTDAMILVFLVLSFKPAFSLSLFTLNKKSLITLPFLPLVWYHLHIWGCWHFSQQSWLQLVIHPAWHFTWCNLHHISWISRVTIYRLVFLLSQFWTSQFCHIWF